MPHVDVICFFQNFDLHLFVCQLHCPNSFLFLLIFGNECWRNHLEVNDHTTGQNIFTSARRLKAADISANHYWVAARGPGALRNSRSWGGWLFNPGLRCWVAPKWYRGGLVRLLHLFYRGIMNAFVPLITFLIEWAISKPCEYNFIRAIINLRFFIPRIKHDKAKACNSYIGII